ncbi:hypothetical protein U1Q18_003920 [Sarracenia purpurea var. burkii]
MGQQGELADIDCRWPSSPANVSPIFYRMIVSSIIHDKKLKIPGKFTKNLGIELPAVATLTTPNGCVWQVGLKKIGGKVWFTNGWHDFVEHQSIRAGYLLIFTYGGNSIFRVNIYNMATAEIKYQCNTLSGPEGPKCGNRCPVSYKEEADDDELVGIFDSISRPSCQTLASFDNKVFNETMNQQNLSRSYDPPLLQNLVKSFFVSDLANDKHDKSKSASEGWKFEHSCSMAGKNSNLEDPKGMRGASYVNEFQAKYNRTGMSKPDGSLADGAKGDEQRVSKNWEKAPIPYFQYEGCNFTGTELKNSKYKADGGNLHADIVRPAGRSTRDIGVQCSYSELMSSGYEIRSHSVNERPEMTRKRKRGIGPYNELQSAAKQGREVQGSGSETSCGTYLRRWRVVTPEEKERVLTESKMFESEYPFCRVILRRSYVYKGIGLHMPSSFAEKYLSGVVSGFITLQVSNGEKWPVRCMWRDGSAKLSKGWPEFVCDNKLEEGDVCVFELIKMGEVVLKVTIFRAVEDAGSVNQLPKEHLGRTNQLAIDYNLNG